VIAPPYRLDTIDVFRHSHSPTYSLPLRFAVILGFKHYDTAHSYEQPNLIGIVSN
jgi:hypothetical protein